MSDLRHEALDAVHRVESYGRLLLQRGQRPDQVVLFQVLLYESNHAGREGEREWRNTAVVGVYAYSADSISSAIMACMQNRHPSALSLQSSNYRAPLL